jgi:hypothetical protein
VPAQPRLKRRVRDLRIKAHVSAHDKVLVDLGRAVSWEIDSFPVFRSDAFFKEFEHMFGYW